MKRTVMLMLVLLAATGCRDEADRSLWGQIEGLSQENTALSLEVQQLRRENAALTEQLCTLAGIDQKERLDALIVPVAVRIGRLSGLYDKSGKQEGSPDTLVVYLEPIDTQQDIVKAAGRVRVELWNLTAPSPQNACIKQWDIDPSQLRQTWGRGLLGAYYRLQLPLEGCLTGSEKELTVRVEFTDYLAGRVLTDQTRIEK
ncbi:MAG: hypothetical protein GX298_04195 [Planctomycetes bacterium]|nr:hypothetical protein [Planctomycetota bacterium]